LAFKYYDVSLIVADTLPDEIKDGVKIFGVKKEKNRFYRILKTPEIVYRKAIELNADVYHLHDPELILIGIKLKKRGKKVIFDSHEDIPMQILDKPYLNKYLLRVISKMFVFFEKKAIKYFDFIIAATPFIRESMLKLHSHVIDINNYPITEELNTIERQMDSNVFFVCYVGGITEIRGIKQMIKALENCATNVRLKLAGDFFSALLRDEVRQYKGWEKVEELGFVDRNGIKKIFTESAIGLVLLLPNENHLNAQPVKLFEYMAASLPVIASNFPHWEEIIKSNQCGICVDPCNSREIALAIDLLINNKPMAEEMGKNGRKAVFEKYNWQNESRKLFDLYDKIEK
jgi:glycosyltransferase involved in cell wall biosynthesis